MVEKWFRFLKYLSIAMRFSWAENYVIELCYCSPKMGICWRWLLCAKTSLVFDVQNFEIKSGIPWCILMVCAMWEFKPGNDSGCFKSMPH